MLLAVDVGNTNTVFAVFDQSGMIRGEWRSSTSAERTADEIGVWLNQVMTLAGIKASDIDAAIIATVVPAVLFNLRFMCRRYFACQPLVIGAPEVNLGLHVVVDRPEEVGADRLVNAVAAFALYGGPLVVVDFGTATTFDVIDGEGSYLGGAIAPGINLSLKALHDASAQLPRVAVGRPDRVIGKGTVQAMRSGVFWGYVSLVEGMVRRIGEEYGTSLDAIATGGLASLFTECTPVLKHADPDLTLKGLFAIHERNREPTGRS
ncbi:MAG: type III pantothenate kinase [Rhodospirillales bacterium]|nr:type III pantothenate kinase [Rhodospirillales bacterium]